MADEEGKKMAIQSEIEWLLSEVKE